MGGVHHTKMQVRCGVESLVSVLFKPRCWMEGRELCAMAMFGQLKVIVRRTGEQLWDCIGQR